MPFFEADGRTLARRPTPLPVTTTAVPSVGETFRAAGRRENIVSNFFDYLTQKPENTRDLAHNPLDIIAGTRFEADYPDRFVSSPNELTTRYIMRQIDQEERTNELLAASGAMGFVASVGMGMLDPTILMPGGAIVKASRAGWTIVRGGASLAVAGAAQAATQEAILYGTQQTRTGQEVAINVGAATILSGLIGAGAGALLSRAERRAMETSLTADRQAWAADLNESTGPQLSRGTQVWEGETYEAIELREGDRLVGNLLYHLDPENREVRVDTSRIFSEVERGTGLGRQMYDELLNVARENGFVLRSDRAITNDARRIYESLKRSGLAVTEDSEGRFTVIPPQLPLPSGTGASVGAATADTRRVEMRPSGINRVFDLPGVRGIAEGPVTQVFMSRFSSGRRTMATLAESPLQMQEHLAGIPTAPGGALSRRMQQIQDQGNVRIADTLDQGYRQYRFGTAETNALGRTRRALIGFGAPPEGKLSFNDFKAQVDWALIHQDQHEIPEVAEAARVIRGITDPWIERAVNVGFFDEIPEVKTAASWSMRDWNTEKIRTDGPELHRRTSDWLASEQATKVGIQSRLEGLQGELQRTQTRMSRLGRTIESRDQRFQQVEVRQEEIRRLNEFAFRRSERLSEPLDALHAEIRGIEARIATQLAQLEALAEEIRTQKANFPGIREADAAIFRLIGAAKKIREGREIVDTVEGMEEFANAIEEARASLAAGARQASSAPARRARLEQGAEALVALERERVRLSTRIRPFRNRLRQLRREYARVRASRIQKAIGGAVFETRIRGRGNTLADQASGRAAELETLNDRLTQAIIRHDHLRKQIEDEISAWEGKSAREAQTAIKARVEAERLRAEKQAAGDYKGKGGRLSSADRAINRAVKRILNSERGLSRQELDARASEIIERIMGGPAGRLPYDAPSGGPHIGVSDELGKRRGSLATRDWMIPDELVWDFLEHDIELKMQKYFRTFIPDVMLAEQFGDVDMTLAFKQLNEEKAALLANPNLTAKQRKAINDEADRVAANIAGVRDRMRSTYGWSNDHFARNMGRVAASVNNGSTLLDMGGVTLASLPDMAGSVFRYGFGSALHGAWIPFLKHLSYIDGRQGAYAQAKRQFRALGIAAETITSSRKNAWSDILVNNRPQSRFEKTLQIGADKFFLINALAAWTDWQKTMAGMVASSEIVRAAKAIAEGGATKKQITRMAESGFDQAGAERLWQEFNRPGGGNKFSGGVHLANTEAWTSAKTRETFEAALGREADIMVVTPGQEKPLWLSRPVGSVLGRFKSFVAAANERLLMANLQQHDFATLQGLVFTVALGMVAESAYSVVTGRDTPKTASDWIKQGMSRSGVLGWFEEGNAISAKATRGTIDIYRLIGSDKPLSRYQSRTLLSSLLGPTAGKVENIGLITGAASTGDWTAADTTRVRRLIAGQNLIYVRTLLDQVEEAVNGFLGVPPKEP